MPDGQLDGARGTESRNAQACLERAVKALTSGRRKKAQEQMDIVHENLRVV